MRKLALSLVFGLFVHLGGWTYEYQMSEDSGMLRTPQSATRVLIGQAYFERLRSQGWCRVKQLAYPRVKVRVLICRLRSAPVSPDPSQD